MSAKPVILIVCDYYLPGYKSGGGMRTIVNIVERLHDLYDFRIITRDHDGARERTPYRTVNINEWNDLSGAKVFYLSKTNIRISKIRELILEVNPASIYLNSCFATPAIFVLKLRKLKLIPDLNLIIAPCGELTAGALNLKKGKKKLFLGIAKLFGLYKNVIWKPSTIFEKEEIERLDPVNPEYFVCADMPAKQIFPKYIQKDKLFKQKGSVKIVILSRLLRTKNLKWLFEILAVAEGKLDIDIYGPIEDEIYWNECKTVFQNLPSQITVEYKGAIPHENVPETLSKYHFFLLPTLGENFGHIFIEALASGCPLIISDTTPWRDLEKNGAGWDISLDDPLRWNQILAEVINLDDSTYQKLSVTARKFLAGWLAEGDIVQDTRKILDYSISK